MSIFKKSFSVLTAVLLVGGLTVGSAQATIISYDIDWTNNGTAPNLRTLTGSFSYDDTTINGDGVITGGELESLSIQAFDSSALLLATSIFDSADFASAAFFFNFNEGSETFLVSGIASSGTGQLWIDTISAGVTFFSDIADGQFILIDGATSGLAVPVSAGTLVATLASGAGDNEVPEPGALALFGSGLLALSVVRRRRKKSI